MRAVRPRFLIPLGVLLVAGAAVAVILLLTGSSGSKGSSKPTAKADAADVVHFHSRPDLTPNRLTVVKPAARSVAKGKIFLAIKNGPGQSGPEIVDDRGRVIWFHPVPKGLAAFSFRQQTYEGKPVLVWWQGRSTGYGHGLGEYIVMNRKYKVIATIKAGGGLMGDHHEIQLTKRGTALFTVYRERPANLSKVGGKKDGQLWDSIVREVNVKTGRIVFSWSAYAHVPLTAGETPPPKTSPHDFFHVNSIDVDHDGNLLVSSRNTFAVYKINRRTGRVMWILGGKRSDFRFGPGARFALQHDVRRQPNGTITMFDNEATPKQAPQSRGIVLRLNMRTHVASLVREYTYPGGLLVVAEGNVQELRGGDVFMSWGAQRHVTELSHGGRLLFDLETPPGADTYRAYRLPWKGAPTTRPSLALGSRASDGTLTAWSSWNGATAVRRWQLVAGATRDQLTPVATAADDGFEATLHGHVPAGDRWVAVRALGSGGRVLRSSRAVALPR